MCPQRDSLPGTLYFRAAARRVREQSGWPSREEAGRIEGNHEENRDEKKVHTIGSGGSAATDHDGGGACAVG